jgi:hypothetical protein
MQPAENKKLAVMKSTAEHKNNLLKGRDSKNKVEFFNEVFLPILMSSLILFAGKHPCHWFNFLKRQAS